MVLIFEKTKIVEIQDFYFITDCRKGEHKPITDRLDDAFSTSVKTYIHMYKIRVL